MKSSYILTLAMLTAVAGAFAPSSVHNRASSSLGASKQSVVDGLRVGAVSSLTAALLAINAASPALAAQQDSLPSFGSTEVLAARSGGRAGGRASSGGASSYRSPTRSSSSTTTYRTSTTIVSPPPVVVAPSIGYSYGYNPLGGVATGYALGTLGNLGNDFRDMRQEQEIQRSRYELEQARMKEAELEGRLRALEQTR